MKLIQKILGRVGIAVLMGALWLVNLPSKLLSKTVEVSVGDMIARNGGENCLESSIK